MELTKRQKEVLKFIKSFVSKNGYPPTRDDICDNFGWESRNNAEQHLRRLERLGAITIAAGISRGIAVVK